MDKTTGRPQQIASEMVGSIPKNFEEAFSRVVKAGMKVMFSDQTHDLMLDELKQEGELSQLAGEAIAGLMALLFKKSNETIPQEVIIPSGVYLLAQAADFIEKVTGQEVTAEVMAGAIQVMNEKLMERFGVNPSKFYGSVEQGMAKLKGAQ